MPRDGLEKIAKGRIWTGEEAKELGLVDELGGFPVALRLVRQAAKLPENAPLRLKVYPEKKTLVKLISELKQAMAPDGSDAGLVGTLEDLQPVMKAFEPLMPSSRADILRMPEVE